MINRYDFRDKRILDTTFLKAAAVKVIKLLDEERIIKISFLVNKHEELMRIAAVYSLDFLIKQTGFLECYEEEFLPMSFVERK